MTIGLVVFLGFGRFGYCDRFSPIRLGKVHIVC